MAKRPVKTSSDSAPTPKVKATASGATLTVNRKAGHEYDIVATYEAGIVLLGTEIKSIREGGVSLRESFCKVTGSEIFLWNAHIAPYSHRGAADHDTTRTRKLLLRREEINKLLGKVVEKGLTLVPTRLYFKDGRVKVELALAMVTRDPPRALDGPGGTGPGPQSGPPVPGVALKMVRPRASAHARAHS